MPCITCQTVWTLPDLTNLTLAFIDLSEFYGPYFGAINHSHQHRQSYYTPLSWRNGFLLNYIFKLHGLPARLISDQDSEWLPHFWYELFCLLRYTSSLINSSTLLITHKSITKWNESTKSWNGIFANLQIITEMTTEISFLLTHILAIASLYFAMVGNCSAILSCLVPPVSLQSHLWKTVNHLQWTHATQTHYANQNHHGN